MKLLIRLTNRFFVVFSILDSAGSIKRGKEHESAVVIDIGNAWARIGFAGEKSPALTVPAFVKDILSTFARIIMQ
jgi:hypothetical protein